MTTREDHIDALFPRMNKEGWLEVIDSLKIPRALINEDFLMTDDQAQKDAALLAVVKEALPLEGVAGVEPGDSCCAKAEPVAAQEVHDFVHALVGGKLSEWLAEKGHAAELDKITPANVLAIVKTVCAVVVPLCGFIGASEPAKAE